MGQPRTGQPRTVSLPPEEMIALGEEMVEWVARNNPLHMSAFYSIHKKILEDDWYAIVRRPEIIPYYERAMRMIGMQYLDKNSNVREGASHRWQRLYFKDLKRLEDEDLRYKIELESKAELKNPPQQSEIDKDHIILRQIAELNELKKKLSEIEVPKQSNEEVK